MSKLPDPMAALRREFLALERDLRAAAPELAKLEKLFQRVENFSRAVAKQNGPGIEISNPLPSGLRGRAIEALPTIRALRKETARRG